jgi:transcriptional regulator with XRE-family HTH domain
MSFRERLGARLVNLRERASLTQEEVCDAVNISQSYYSQIEGGNRNVSIEMLAKIAKGLDTTLERIFKGM